MALTNGEAIQTKLRRIDDKSFLLTSRGFHWINEYPFKRWKRELPFPGLALAALLRLKEYAPSLSRFVSQKHRKYWRRYAVLTPCRRRTVALANL